MVAAGPADARESPDETSGKILGRLWRQLRPQRGKVILAGLCLAAQSACLLAGPFLVKIGIDRGLQAGDVHTLDLVVLLYVVVAFGALAFARLSIMMVARLGEAFLRDLRVHTFRHLMDLGLDFFEREQTGRLVGRMTTDVDALQELVQQGLTSIVQNALLFVGALVVIFVLSWQLALCVMVVVPPLYFVTRWFRRESNAAFLAVRDRIGHNMSTLQEGLSGIRIVQAYGRQAAFAGRFRETNEAQFDANMKTAKIAVRYFPVVEMSGVIVLAIIVGAGGFFVDQSILTVGTIAAFVLYMNNLVEPVQQLSQLYNTVQSAGAALNKLFGLADVVPLITESPDALALPARGAVEVADVSFAYGTTDVLRDVRMTIAPGERVALVGPTGAGKSTLAKLIARFYDPRAGSISVTRRSPRSASASWWFRRKASSSPVPCATTSGWPGPRPATAKYAPRSRAWDWRHGSMHCRRASTPRCASEGRGCPPASASWYRWHALHWWIPRSSCSTKPRRISTLAPNRWSSAPWSHWRRAAPPWSSRIGSPPRRARIASGSSSTASSPSSVRTTSSWPSAVATQDCSRPGRRPQGRVPPDRS